MENYSNMLIACFTVVVILIILVILLIADERKFKILVNGLCKLLAVLPISKVVEALSSAKSRESVKNEKTPLKKSA